MNINKISITTVVFSLTLMNSVLSVSAATLDKSNPHEYVPQQLIVQFKDGHTIKTMSRHNHSFSTSNHSLSHSSTQTQFSVFNIKKNIDLKTVYEQYQSDPSISAVSYNYIRNFTVVPNDPAYIGAINHMWALHDTAPDLTPFLGPSPEPNSNDPMIGNDIKAEKAWDIWATVPAINKTNVVVAVLDSGVDYDHPDLIDAMWDGSNATPASTFHGRDTGDNDNDPYPGLVNHGSHVSGIIAATSNNAIGIPSIASGVKIMAVKISDDLEGRVSDSAIISGVNYAVQNGAHIINMSFGRKTPENKVMTQTMIDAVNAGVLLVAAAGNDGTDNDIPFIDKQLNEQYNWPSNYANLPATKAGFISVAATDQADLIADFSNFGAKTVNLGAPGVNILSTITGNEIKPENIASGKNIPLNLNQPIRNNGLAGEAYPSCSASPDTCFDQTFFSNLNASDCVGTNCNWGWLRDPDGLSLIGDAFTLFPNKYVNLIDGTVTSRVISTSPQSKIFLSFRAKWDLECDYDYVDVEVFDGINWILLSGQSNSDNYNETANGQCLQVGSTLPSQHTLTGRMGSFYKNKFNSIPDWRYVFNISQYNNPNLQVRFHFATDATKNAPTKTNIPGALTIKNIAISTQISDYSNAYGFKTGTSMSSPLVAGIAALVKGANPSYTGPQIKAAILTSGESNISLAGITSSGKRANAFNTLSSIEIKKIDQADDNKNTNSNKKGKSGGCSLNNNAAFDPVFPVLLLISLLFWTRKIIIYVVKKNN